MPTKKDFEEMKLWFKDPNGYKKTLMEELNAIESGDISGAKIATETIARYFYLAQLERDNMLNNMKLDGL